MAEWQETRFRSANNLIREVVVKETYPDSGHYFVYIVPEGYGESPAPLEFGEHLDREGELIQYEGYGIFRAEYAFGLAKLLTAEVPKLFYKRGTVVSVRKASLTPTIDRIEVTLPEQKEE